ncbi:FAD-dependent oxidoreductase [Marinobacterium sp. D7]|uniref:NAD(P)/FAD-dependent oxidoreductase n=1 Tax=Marinobacterium ramblicola TaxID=2849041 RepID=UPI001C2D05A2|nr:FAD-dependent oxidoreductase [Marinobacterium ramblicola]MBV1786700.1 FAD-dependent oxidoreductase [Marinobacterium ramblicola]
MNQHVDLIIVGNGMAGNRLVQELAKQPHKPESILVIGEEPRHAYNRVLLSPLLAGEMKADEVALQDADWYREQGIELISGDPVASVDLERRQLVTQSGYQLGFQRIVFATGSRANMPPLPGIELDGVMGFRTWDDVEQMQQSASQGGHAVVVGGGLLGLEAAEGLRKLGMQTTVLQRGDRLLNLQLDATAAGLLRDELTGRGLDILLDAEIDAIEGEAGKLTGVRLKNGQQLKADLLVLAIGVKPEISLARAAGLRCNRAIEVDATLHTSHQNVFALGECCEFEQNTYGLVAPIWRQAEVLARVLCGEEHAYSEQPVATQLKVSGISLFSCGEIDAVDAQPIEYLDRSHAEYRKLWLRDGRIVGAVLYGDTRFGPWYFEQLLNEQDLGHLRAQLLFGPPPDTQVA